MRFVALFLLVFVGMTLSSFAQQEPSLKDLLPPLQPLGPAEAVKALKVAPGFRVELVACEPDVVSPIAMAFDENGRLFVAEDIDYPYPPKKGEKPLGRIRMLEDKDGDGRYETSVIYADGLQYPSGIACSKGGIFVSAPPQIVYLKDTDGDGKADIRRVAFDGFGTQSSEDIMNNLKWGIDNWIYGASSYNGGDISWGDLVKEGKLMRTSVRGRDFRFHPDSLQFVPLAGTGDFGNAFDDFGNRFVSNAGMLLIHNVLPGDYLARNPFLNVAPPNYNSAASKRTVASIAPVEPWRAVRKKFWQKWVNTTPDMKASRFSERELAEGGYVTGGAGCEIYRGDAFPAEFRGSSFTAEPACNVVIRLKLKENGVTFDAAAVNEKQEFLASPDNWFRPVNVSNGPDGCLLICDMAREIIEDPSAIPEDILKIVDVTRGRDKGRIFRVVPEGHNRPPLPKLGKATTAELVLSLESPNAWTRETAQRLLVERGDAMAADPLRTILKSSKSPQARLHAFYTLHGLGALGGVELLQSMDDSHPALCEHAIRLSEPLLAESLMLRNKVIALAVDERPRVRMQVAFSLGEIAVLDGTAAVLAKILARDAGDPWIGRAVLSSVGSRPGTLFTALSKDAGFLDRPMAAATFASLAEQAAAQRDNRELPPVLKALDAFSSHPKIAEAVLLACADAKARSGQSFAAVLTAESATSAWDLFQSSLTSAVKTVEDAKSSPADKLRAVRFLRHASPLDPTPILESLIDAAQPPELQLASIQALAAQDRAPVAKALLSRWRNVSPQVHREMIEALLRDPSRLPPLIEALESSLVHAAEIDPPHREAILKKAAKDLRPRAEAVFARFTTAPRQHVVEKYQAALKLPGDVKRGSELFGKHCATCHRLGSIGKAVGPDLVAIQNKTPDAILLSILDPSREVAGNFLNYVVTTKNGRVITGMLAGESTGAITLRRAEGAEDVISRSDIDELASTGKSLMPEGLEQQLDAQAIADVVQFLLGPPRK